MKFMNILLKLFAFLINNILFLYIRWLKKNKLAMEELLVKLSFTSLDFCFTCQCVQLCNVVQGDPESADPIVHDNGVSYMFIQHNNVFFMAASRQNCNAASIIFFLHRVIDVSTIGSILVLEKPLWSPEEAFC